MRAKKVYEFVNPRERGIKNKINLGKESLFRQEIQKIKQNLDLPDGMTVIGDIENDAIVLKRNPNTFAFAELSNCELDLKFVKKIICDDLIGIRIKSVTFTNGFFEYVEANDVLLKNVDISDKTLHKIKILTQEEFHKKTKKTNYTGLITSSLRIAESNVEFFNHDIECNENFALSISFPKFKNLNNISFNNISEFSLTNNSLALSPLLEINFNNNRLKNVFIDQNKNKKLVLSNLKTDRLYLADSKNIIQDNIEIMDGGSIIYEKAKVKEFPILNPNYVYENISLSYTNIDKIPDNIKMQNLTIGTGNNKLTEIPENIVIKNYLAIKQKLYNTSKIKVPEKFKKILTLI